MMQRQHSKSTRKSRSPRRGWLLVGLVAAALLTAGVGSGPSSGGPWQNDALTTSCPAGQICAEWPFSNGTSNICCIMLEDMGSNNYNCVTYLGSRDPDGMLY